MMVFRQIRDAILRALADNADGEFKVIGAQKRGKAASEVKNKDRLVEVYYARGDFPKSGASVMGPTKHDMTFRVDASVSKPAQAIQRYIDVIENPASLPADVVVAVANIRESDFLADRSFDELFERVYQILMDPRNDNFGLEVGSIGSRWVQSVNKDETTERGNLSVITGSIQLTGTTSEAVEGYKGTEGAKVFDIGVDIETDEPGKAGVEIGA